MNAVTETVRAAPDITVAKSTRRVTVRFNQQIIADTARAQVLREGSRPAVYYLPLADVRQEYLDPTDHRTFCPFKGEANYWSIKVGEAFAENAIWGYPHPLPALRAIKGHVAFYGDRVDVQVM
ncbi:MAG: DUF427 domain-containing protein [Magnetovibrionaceae bacterium]